VGLSTISVKRHSPLGRLGPIVMIRNEAVFYREENIPCGATLSMRVPTGSPSRR
jgi:hypothetical protein